MARDRSKPSSVILDLLRSSRSRAHSARALIRFGAVFGYTENTIRVTLSRLVARGLVESPERGRYRLAPSTDPLNDFVERWRLGEARVRKWREGAWLLAHGGDTGRRARWALHALGFRELRAGLWARPDNLALVLPELRVLAESIGVDRAVSLFEAVPEGEPVPRGWLRAWQPRALDRAYADAIARLEASRRRLERLPRAEAMLESFTLGGEVVHRLAKDPLLPEPMVKVEDRARLTALMHDYDALGREIWARGGEDTMLVTPRPQLEQAS